MNKKYVFLGSCLLGLFISAAPLRAQANYDQDDISAILEDNALRDAATRYTSVLSFFFPEEATRLGFFSSNNLLNDRSPETESQALQALQSIREAVKTIDNGKLSQSKRAEQAVLFDALTRNIWELEQNRLATNPVYYAQALDAVYDLLLLPNNSEARKKRTDLLGRVAALPKVAQQAKENLTQVSPFAARLAMEKAYYAYLSFDEVANKITRGSNLTNDVRDAQEDENTVKKAKTAIREMFDFFKELSQQESNDANDFRMGAHLYARQLKEGYQISDTLAQLGPQLDKDLDQAQHALFDALQPFQLSAEDEQVTVVEEGNQIPQIQPILPAEPKKEAPVAQAYVPPTANQFYAVAKQLQSPLKADEVLQQISQHAANLATKWVKTEVLPATAPLKINELLPYFAYQMPYLYNPTFGAFLLRVPTGNQLAKEEMLQRDFNEPAYKMLITQEIVPGRYYQSAIAASKTRRLFGTPVLANGWTLYALEIAQQQGYLITDEERLFVAWQRYLKTLSAWLDYRLNTLALTHPQAVTLLTQTNGFSQEEAILLLNGIIRNPGQAVSYVWGEKAWQKAAAPYTKKPKDAARLPSVLLQVGNVSPKELSKEIKRIYKKK